MDTTAGLTWTYSYANDNHMITAKEVTTTMTAVQATYTYDYFGNLVEEVSTVGGTTTTHAYAIDQWNPADKTPEVWADLSGTVSPTITAQYLRGDQVDQILRQRHRRDVAMAAHRPSGIDTPRHQRCRDDGECHADL